MTRDTVSAPHCPRCGRYMAGVRVIFKADLYGEYLQTVYAHCARHGLQEVVLNHCDGCDCFLDADAWEPSYEVVKVREGPSLARKL